MLEKIKSITSHSFLRNFKDIHFIGLCIIGVIVLSVSWSGAGIIDTNYKLQRQISELQQKNEVTELQNKNLELSNKYYATNQYLELQARRQFGKGAPGETLVLVPKSVALSYTVDLSKSTSQKPDNGVEKPFYQKNFEAWMDFFFRFQRSANS